MSNRKVTDVQANQIPGDRIEVKVTMQAGLSPPIVVTYTGAGQEMLALLQSISNRDLNEPELREEAHVRGLKPVVALTDIEDVDVREQMSDAYALHEISKMLSDISTVPRDVPPRLTAIAARLEARSTTGGS